MTFSRVTEDGMEHDGWVLRIEELPDAVLKAIGNGKTIELHAYKELEEVVRKKVWRNKGATWGDSERWGFNRNSNLVVWWYFLRKKLVQRKNLVKFLRH